MLCDPGASLVQTKYNNIVNCSKKAINCLKISENVTIDIPVNIKNITMEARAWDIQVVKINVYIMQPFLGQTSVNTAGYYKCKKGVVQLVFSSWFILRGSKSKIFDTLSYTIILRPRLFGQHSCRCCNNTVSCKLIFFKRVLTTSYINWNMISYGRGG